MLVEMWPISRPIPYARNPRKITQAAIDKVAASIKEFGWQQCIVVDKDDVIIAGHTRLLAAQKLGLAEVPVKVATDLTKAQIKAYRIADNRTGQEAKNDDELMALELEDLKGLDFDMSLTGFDDFELDSLLAIDSDQPDKAADRDDTSDDDAPADDEEVEGEESAKEKGVPSDGSLLERLSVTINDPKTKVGKGEIWRLGKHILVCGSVIADWPVWAKFLEANFLFCPFPGPFVLISKKAKDYPLLLVQPDSYIAGHVIDRYVEVHGAAEVKQQS